MSSSDPIIIYELLFRKIYAVEHDKLRYKVLLETIKRCNLKCVTPYRDDVLKLSRIRHSEIDYIALDPSCSGTGNVVCYSLHFYNFARGI